MTTINYFTYENCYRGILSEASFNEYKDSKFDIYPIKHVEECDNLAVDAKTQFFFISDLCNNTMSSNCYIPKVITGDYFKDTLADTFKPFSDILDEVLGNKSGRTTRSIESSNNLVLSDNSRLKCLHYLPDGKYYAPTNSFALYNSSTLDQNIVNSLKQIQSYDYYKNKLTEISNYNDLIKTPNLNISDNTYSGGGNIATSFKTYICNPIAANKGNFKYNIEQLQEKYNNLFNKLNEISNDLSNISLLTKNDSQFILEIDKLIASKKFELDQLLGSGGGNNGRLADTNYLKNLKFIEIIIVSLVLLIAIFIYNKKK